MSQNPLMPTVTLDHFANLLPLKVDPSPNWEYSPEELVDKSLKALQATGIQLTEFLSILYRRMGVPVIIKVRRLAFFGTVWN